MAQLKKYLNYEKKVLAKRKAEKVFKKPVKVPKAKKKKLLPKQKKMIRKVRSKRFLSTLPNPYGIKI